VLNAKEYLEGSDDLHKLQEIINLMGYISMDLKEITCLNGLAVFDKKLNAIYCESKDELRNDRSCRSKVEEFIKENPSLTTAMKEVLKSGHHKKIHLQSDESFLILPMMGSRKPFGLVGIVYESDGCQHEECTADLLFKDVLNIFMTRYQEMKDKQNMAAMSCRLKSLADYEKYAILETGKRCNWNISSMAKELEIGRNTLYQKLKKMGIN
jgi:hypothetical protein